MQLSELLTELYAFGWEDWDDGSTGEARAKRLLNESNAAICNDSAWPFLATNASGSAPLTVADLRFVELVTNTVEDRPLLYVDEEELRYWYPDLSGPGTGTPIWWYRPQPDQIAVYPTSSDEIRVDYVKRPALLDLDTDVPEMPEEFHLLIVQGAVIRAQTYKDQATVDSAAVLRAEFDRGLEEMRQALLIGQREAGQINVQTTWYDGGWW